MPLFFSNADLFEQIARTAEKESQRLVAEGRRPNPNGDGYIIKYDPEQRSMQQALIAIMCASACFEARFALLIAHNALPESLDGGTYPKRLKKLGVEDEATLEFAERFRLVRNSVIHEKPNTAFTQDETANLLALGDRELDQAVRSARASWPFQGRSEPDCASAQEGARLAIEFLDAVLPVLDTLATCDS